MSLTKKSTGNDDEEEEITLEEQFVRYAAMLEPQQSDGTLINLYRIDYWLRQARILEDRNVTMTDTGILFFRYNKSEINIKEFKELLRDLADMKGLNLEDVLSALCYCGIPGEHPVEVPQYRDYFLTWKPKNQLRNPEIDEKKY